MAIDVNYVLERLFTLQIEYGGYYGTDVTKLSKELGVTPRGLRKQISEWKRSIQEFRDLRYLGKRPPSVTLNEFIEIEARMHSNPIEVKSRVLEDIRADRLTNAKRHIEKYGISAAEFYPRILTRGGHLRSLLSSIPPHQQEETQARLFFEMQVAYVVECTDLFVTEIVVVDTMGDRWEETEHPCILSRKIPHNRRS